jgi:hypothetical protein
VRHAFTFHTCEEAPHPKTARLPLESERFKGGRRHKSGRIRGKESGARAVLLLWLESVRREKRLLCRGVRKLFTLCACACLAYECGLDNGTAAVYS